MKTYENESMFVTNFAKDCKEQLKNGQKFEAEWNGVEIVITGMDNNNASKVTMYTGTINGVQFKGNITQLKKRLNIAYTKEYNRSSEAARTANTKVVIKTDEELQATAENENMRFINAVNTVLKIARRYSFSELLSLDNLANIERDGVMVGNDDTTVSTHDCILDTLKVQRDAAKAEAEKREAERKAEAERKENHRANLLKWIAEASTNGQIERVMELSKELSKLK